MDWIQFAIFGIGVFGLFIWNRTEGRADARHMDAKLKAEALHMDAKLEAALNAMNANVQCMQQEMKDFHGKLCSIQEKVKK
jgi:hypothetical protein